MSNPHDIVPLWRGTFEGHIQSQKKFTLMLDGRGVPMQPSVFSTDLISACATGGNERAMEPALRNLRDPSCLWLSTEVSLRYVIRLL